MKEKHALIIGASSGIGAATAEQLARGDWLVTAAARRSERLVALASKFPNIRSHQLDATDRSAVEEVVRNLPAVDALIYAAGHNIPERELDVLSENDWRQLFDVNVHGAFHAIQAVLPKMRTAGGGLIVLISSISAERGDASGAAYQASKRALHGLAEAVSFEEGFNRIRTTVIMPGLTRTDFNSLRRTPPSEEARREFLSAEDVAGAAAYVCNLPSHVFVPSLTIVPTSNPWNR